MTREHLPLTRHHGADALARAVAVCPVEAFHGPDGRAVRPRAPAAVTRRHLCLLDPRAGENILEAGTGSGYGAS